MHHEICARSLLAQRGALAAGLGSRGSQESHTSDKNRRAGDKGTAGALPRAQETMRFLREEKHWEVGRSEGTRGTGRISAGGCRGRVRSLGEKGTAAFPV